MHKGVIGMFFEVYRGLGEYSAVHVGGLNPDVDAGSGFECVWNGGGPYTGHNVVVAEPLEIFSSSASDTYSGSGARSVRVEGLNAALEPIYEIVLLAGVTPVFSTQSFFRVQAIDKRNAVSVVHAGALGMNQGQITVRQRYTPANVFAVMP